jgi:ABC-2 type transport system ATP-binding protein
VLLTTQYLDEADRLADRIAVVDHGLVIASGTSGELKAQVGGERLEITVAKESSLDAAVSALQRYGQGEVQVDGGLRHLTFPVTNGSRLLPDIVRDLDSAEVHLDNLALRHPTLDDVFLQLTGHAAEESLADEAAVREQRQREEVA